MSMSVACELCRELCRELISIACGPTPRPSAVPAPTVAGAAQYEGEIIGGGGMMPPPGPPAHNIIPPPRSSPMGGGACKPPGVGVSLKSGGGAAPCIGAVGGAIPAEGARACGGAIIASVAGCMTVSDQLTLCCSGGGARGTGIAPPGSCGGGTPQREVADGTGGGGMVPAC